MKFARRFARWGTITLTAVSVWSPVTMARAGQPSYAAGANPQTPRFYPRPSTDNTANVQVAWMADPALFACHLQAKPAAQGLEVCGFVPNEMIRQKAIQIAKSQFEGRVIDRLQVQPGMPLAIARPAEPNELAATATNVMSDTLGDKVLGLQLSCPAPGRVEVTGTVGSAAEKLEISKSLRGVPGCTHVVNRVTTGPSESSVMARRTPPKPTTEIAKAPEKTTARDTRPSLPDTEGPPLPRVASANVELSRIAMPEAAKPVAPKQFTSGIAAISVAPRNLPEAPKAEPVVERAPVSVVKAPPETPTKPHTPTTANAGYAIVTMPQKPETPTPVLAVPSSNPKPPETQVAIVKAEITPPQTVAPNNQLPVGPTAAPVVTETPKPIETPVVVAAAPPVESKAAEPSAQPAPELRLPPTEAKPVEIAPAPAPAAAVPQPKPEPIVPVAVPVIESPKPVETRPTPLPAEISKPKEVAPTMETPKPEPVRAQEPVIQPPARTEIKEMTASTVVKNAEPSTGFAEARNGRPCKEVAKPITSSCLSTINQTIPSAPPEAVMLEPKFEEPKSFPATRAPQEPRPVVSQASFSTHSEGAKPTEARLNESKLMGILRAPESQTPCDSASARAAIEALCRAENLNVTVQSTGQRQVSLALTVKEASEWSALQAKLKSCRETAGYSMVYRVAVGEGTAPEAFSKPEAPANSAAKPAGPAPMMGVIRGKGTGRAAEPEMVRKVIEQLCREHSEDLSIKTSGSKQVAIAMKVNNPAEWDQLYSQIRNLPEIADYAVIFNIRVR
ncbi:MAG: BON domain-containing protein [Gemmataceae bacterium]